MPPFKDYLARKELVEFERELFKIKTRVEGAEIEAQRIALEKGMPAGYQFLIDVYLKGSENQGPLYEEVLGFYETLLKKIVEYKEKGKEEIVMGLVDLVKKYEPVIRTVNKTLEEKVKPAYEAYILKPLKQRVEEAKKNLEELQKQAEQAEKLYKGIKQIEDAEKVLKQILS